jgi:hypothetical protein
MDLLEYSEKVVPKPSLRDVRSRATWLWDRVYRIIGNESRTDPTIAAVLSQIVLLTDEFTSALERCNLDPKNDSSREVILLNRASWSEYVLLVADDHFDGHLYAGDATLHFSDASLERAVWRWQQPPDNWVGKGDPYIYKRLFRVYRNPLSWELSGLDQFTVYFVKRPRLIRTSVPIPAWEVTSPVTKGHATAGCYVQHADGHRFGVTSVRHFFPAGNVTGTIVDVHGMPGAVAGEDLMSDSVFIHMPSVEMPPDRLGVKGWLQGVAPRHGESAMFEGATSHTTKTAVAGQDPGLTQYSPYRQLRIYTPAVTNPGDSGAALIEESTDLIIGFAHERTAAGEPIEWSSWIWADSVFNALKVRPMYA